MQRRTLPVAILGSPLTYHGQLATQLFPARKLLECESFNDLCQAVSRNEATGVIAVKNSIGGTISAALKCIKTYSNISIKSYAQLNITHILAALPDTKIESITQIHSHPAALRQCRRFIKKHQSMFKSKEIEQSDTVEALKIALTTPNAAAICSRYAAQKLDAAILATDIADESQNKTTFAIIEAML